VGRGVLPQIPNCHVPYKEEAAKGSNYKGMQHAKREVIKKQQKRAGIPSKKEREPSRKRGYYEDPGKPKSLTRGFQATHELGGLNVEVQKRVTIK